MPCSYIAVADHIEPSNASEAVSGLVLAPGGPLEGPKGPWTSPGGQIWAQMPAASPPGWTASISWGSGGVEVGSNEPLKTAKRRCRAKRDS